MSTFGKVAVLMGGASSEREVSLMSGQAVLTALREQGVDAHAFDPSERPLSDLVAEKFERVMIALHGRGGEDGTLQGALETLGIPYTGSGVLGSALAMDKFRTKLIWTSLGVPTAPFCILESAADFAAAIAQCGLPLMVKAAHEGSSIGIVKVNSADELPAAFAFARQFDLLVFAERFIAGQELTVAILDGVALPIVRIEAPDGNYDYQNKYFTDVTRYHCPADVNANLALRIQADALKAFRSLGCAGWGRADVILQPDGHYYFLELNTAPGMTGHSLVPIAARQAGLSFPALCLRILASAALERSTQGGDHVG